jgi:hypothetical protein
MINVTKTISTSIKNAVRFVKFLRMGKSDVQECRQASPFGVDSAPISDMAAIYAKTGEVGKPVVIGYINKNQIADVGENRLFSTDSDGNVVFYIHMKNDGTAEIGGDSDNMVRYSELESAFNELRSDLNSLITAYNTHAHPYVGLAVTVPGVTSPTSATGTPSTADITPAKINEIKTL